MLSIIVWVALFTSKQIFLPLSQLKTDWNYYYVMLMFPVLSLNQFQLFLFQVRKKAKLFSLVCLLSIVSVSSFSIVYVVFYREGINGYMKGRILGLLLVVLLCFLLQWKEFLGCPSLKQLRKLLKYCLPSLPGQLFQKIKALLERQIIVIFVGLAILGNYSITLKLLLPIGLFIESFRLSWVGFVSSTITQSNNKELYSKTLSGYVLALTILSVPMVIFAKELILVFAGEKFNFAHQPFSWLLFNIILGSVVNILSVGLGISEKTKYMSYAAIISGVAAIGLYFIFVPILQLWGMLMAQSFGVATMLFITFYYSNKFFKMSYDIIRCIKLGAIYITLSIFIHFLNQYSISFVDLVIIKVFILFFTLLVIRKFFQDDFLLINKILKKMLKTWQIKKQSKVSPFV